MRKPSTAFHFQLPARLIWPVFTEGLQSFVATWSRGQAKAKVFLCPGGPHKYLGGIYFLSFTLALLGHCLIKGWCVGTDMPRDRQPHLLTIWINYYTCTIKHMLIKGWWTASGCSFKKTQRKQNSSHIQERAKPFADKVLRAPTIYKEEATSDTHKE